MSDGLTEKYRRAKLDEDIAELEAKMYGTPEEESPNKAEQEEQVLDGDKAVSPDQSDDFKIKLTDDIFDDSITDEDTQPSESELVADLRKQLADEKHRFNRYKGSTDRSLFQLRSENASLNKRVASMGERIRELSETGQDEGLGEDSRSILGDEAADIIEGLKKEIKNLKNEINENSSSKYTENAENLNELNDLEFRDRLRELVPDMDEMNKDKGFNEWLRQPDELGVERLKTLRSDQKRYDYARVAGFFKEYKEITKAKAKVGSRKVEDTIDAHTGPKGKSSNSSSPSSRASDNGWIKQSEINRYQEDIAHGKYRNNSTKAEAMEMRIFQAISDGKIINDETPSHRFRLS